MPVSTASTPAPREAVSAEQGTMNESGSHDDALALHNFLKGKRSPQLPEPYPQKYGVHDHCVVCNGSLPKFKRKYCSQKCSFELFKYQWGIVQPKILKRDHYTCQRCGWNPDLPIPEKWKQTHKYTCFSVDVHHILPIAMGGTNEDNNLTTLCMLCHRDSHKHESKVPSQKVLKAVRSNSLLTAFGRVPDG